MIHKRGMALEWSVQKSLEGLNMLKRYQPHP